MRLVGWQVVDHMPILTWGLFKEIVEGCNVKDDTHISWIDISGWDGFVSVRKDGEDCVNIS